MPLTRRCSPSNTRHRCARLAGMRARSHWMICRSISRVPRNPPFMCSMKCRMMAGVESHGGTFQKGTVQSFRGMRFNGFASRCRSVLGASRLAVCLAAIGLSACGSDQPVQATTEPGPSPFISMMHVQGINVGAVTSVEYAIEPQPGSVSRPVHVQYSIAALRARGYATDAKSFIVPVFGLYAGYENQV